MKAVRYHKFGGPEVLQIDEVPIPEPGPGQIQVKVAGYGVNPIDWKLMTGELQFGEPHFPVTLGFELSGEVTKLGEGVTGFEVGDHVFGETRTHGAAAEYSILPTNAAVKHPPMLDLVDSAGLVVAGLTAWQALFDQGLLQSGQKVLIHAAGGGVGSLAVQLAKWKGAYVIGTGGTKNDDFVRELGADDYVDYTKAKYEDVLAPDIDLVIDTLGGDTSERSRKVLKKGGRLVSITAPPDVAAFEAEGKHAIHFGMQPQVSQLEQIRNLVQDDILRLVVALELPLDRTAEAIAEGMKGHTRGKIIVRVG